MLKSTYQHKIFFRYTGAVDAAGKKVQVETDLKLSKSKGSGSAKLQLPEIKPISGEVSFSCNHEDKGDASILINYGDNKKFQTSMNVLREGTTAINVDLAVSGDGLKTITVNVNAKQPIENQLLAKMNVKADSQEYSLDYEHRLSEREPKFSVVIVRPQGTSKILAEAQIASQLKGKGSFVLENLESFDLHANVDGDLSSLEHFYLIGDLDSPKLQINKFTFDIKSKDGAAGRTGFDFKLTKEGKHLVSGSTDFTTKTDKGRTVLEGKSTIKLTEGKSDEVSFKLIRNIFENARDGETGFGGILNVFIGPRNFASELKLTDKEFHAKYTGCETKNRCTNLETKSLLQQSSVNGFKHNLVITIDLRQVGFSHEFGLKADTSRDGWKFNHVVDAYLQAQDKPEYQYSLFINPSEAGALLSLPTRQVALDATYKYPSTLPFGTYDGTVAFFIDKKNKPRQKTEIGVNAELKQDDRNLLTGKGNIHFEHPRVKKLTIVGEFSANPDAMDVKSKLEFDIFTNPMDKIVVIGNFGNSDASGRGFNVTSDVEVSSKGLGIEAKYHQHAGLSFDQRLVTIGSDFTLPVDEFRFGLHANLNENNGELIIVCFGQPVLTSTATYDLKKPEINIETVATYLGLDPIVEKITISGLTQGKFSLTKGNLINIDTGYEIGKDIHLTVIGSGNEIFNGKIALDQSHFLTSTYHVDDVQLKSFATQLQDSIKADYEKTNEAVKEKITKLQSRWTAKLEKIQQASPDFKRLQQEYKDELNKLVDELKQDPAIKKLIDSFTTTVAELAKTFNTLAAAINEQLVTIETALKEYYEQATTAFNEKILPELKRLHEAVHKLVSELYEQTVKILTAVFERVAKALKTFEGDFNKISKVLKEATGGACEAIGQYIREITKEIKDLITLIKEQIQSLPGIEYVKDKYKELVGDFNPVDTLKAVLVELINAVSEFVPEQAKPFFDQLLDYMRKVRKNIACFKPNLNFNFFRNLMAMESMMLQSSKDSTRHYWMLWLPSERSTLMDLRPMPGHRR